MSCIARLYSILSGSAVLSALVDLLTFFFLCRSWAWLEPTLNSNAAINVDVNIHVRVRRRRKLHLSPENLPPPPEGRARSVSPVFPVYLNQRTGSLRSCPFSPGSLVSELFPSLKVASIFARLACSCTGVPDRTTD